MAGLGVSLRSLWSSGAVGVRLGVLDSIEIQLRPVLFGQSRRLFDGRPAEHIELDLVSAPGARRPAPALRRTPGLIYALRVVSRASG